MYKETQKLHLIEEVLKTNDETLLTEIETVLNRHVKTREAKPFSAHELTGRWSKKDAALIEKAIEDGCEQINEDEWK
jgi:hypothetical protein